MEQRFGTGGSREVLTRAVLPDHRRSWNRTEHDDLNVTKAVLLSNKN